MDTGIDRLRRIGRWIDFQRESYWLPENREPLTIPEILEVYACVVDVLGYDLIEDAIRSDGPFNTAELIALDTLYRIFGFQPIITGG